MAKVARVGFVDLRRNKNVSEGRNVWAHKPNEGAASSVSANIAEGCGRGSDADLSRFLQIAFGSISELDCHLILARDLNLLSVKTYEDIYSRVVEVRRMLASLIRKIKAGT